MFINTIKSIKTVAVLAGITFSALTSPTLHAQSTVVGSTPADFRKITK